jgi:acyl-CoA thioesterase
MNESDLETLLRNAPFTGFLGHRLISAGGGAARLALAPRAEFEQEAGRLHGGVLTALADSAGVYALLSTGRWEPRFTGVELKLNFLRPAALAGADLEARGRVVTQGRRVAVCEVEVEQAGRLLAKGLFTYLAAPEA